MEMQNVTNLTIPEGEVRTIHNSSDELLWGKLNYSVKYAGDTFQQTYTGKNLLPPTQDFQETLDGVNIDYSAGVFTIDGTSETSGAHTATWRSLISSYTIQSGDYWHYNNDFSSQQMLIQIRFTDNTTLAQAITEVNRVLDLTDYVGKTIKDMRLYFQGGYTYSGTMSPMIVNGVSTATAYEPYVGGAPAPNPDYPQDIHVATGSQTITLSDGVISQAYTIDLGLIELAKIGTYQDYIYKSGDDWYIHKEIGEYTFDGTEDWLVGPYGTNSWVLKNLLITFDTTKTQIISNLFRGVSANERGTAGNNIIYTDSNNSFTVRNTSFTTKADMQDITNGNYVYYALAAPTDTKITDNTLIGELAAIDEWMTRYGYQATVSGSLPIIIQQTNLT